MAMGDKSAGAASGMGADAAPGADGAQAVPDAVPPAFDAADYRLEEGAAFASQLGQGRLVVQGPMGTALMAQPGAEEIPAAYWNLAEPETVTRLHALYLAAGADVLLTNSFQAQGPALERDGVYASVREVNAAAVRAAYRAGGRLVLGSVGPCGIGWIAQDSPEFRRARSVYRVQIHALLSAGATGIMVETLTCVNDIIAALTAAADVAAGMPVLTSFAVDDAGNLLSDGLPLETAVLYAEKHGAASVGVNCCSLAAADAAVDRLLAVARTPVSVRPNAGDPHRDDDGQLAWDEDPDAFGRAAARWAAAGVALVGSCCGTTARTTCALRLAVDDAPADAAAAGTGAR